VTARLHLPGLNTGEAAGDAYNTVEGLIGGGFNDVLVGNGIANILFGQGGNDALHGVGGNDQLRGGTGHDTLLGGTGADALFGDAGFDYASYALAAAAVTARLDAPDLNIGEAAGDTYNTVEGLIGGGFNDVLVGNGFANILFGQGGNDALHGAGGNDRLRGGAGADVLAGGTGNDVLFGEAGADAFVFRNGENVDVVQGFENNIDTARLDDNLWGGGMTVAQVLATFATQGANFVDLNFGGGDLLRVSQAGITVAALQDDITII
jgi:serralysin